MLLKTKSKYKNVKMRKNMFGEISWKAFFFKKGTKMWKYFKTEKEAAIYVDKKLIQQGKNPVNILIKK